MRLDKALVAKKMVSSRTLAQRLIEKGHVKVSGQVETKPSRVISEQEFEGLEVNSDALELKYVSRGGIKLEGALRHTKINIKEKIILDIGTSTGGFTDCLLQKGCRHVTGIDVGQGQLAESLKYNSKLKVYENLNVRDLKNKEDIWWKSRQLFDLCVVDVSFISLEKVWPQVVPYIKHDGALLSLVKPQFELQASDLNKSGVVKEASQYDSVESKIRKLAENVKLNVKDYFPSQIEGGDGNKEFFCWATL